MKPVHQQDASDGCDPKEEKWSFMEEIHPRRRNASWNSNKFLDYLFQDIY